MPLKTTPTVLNYTTSIDPVKSAMECVTRLMYHGAHGVAITGANGQPTGLSFQIVTRFGPRQYNVPVNVPGTQKALTEAWRKGRIAQRYTDAAQAQRVAWRVIKDWLEAQLALIEAGVADMPQVMLPYMQVDDGETVWDRYLANELEAIEGRQKNECRRAVP